MVNADDLCQYARLSQTSKIQKCLQTHCVDVNALNLYGESALSTATYYNQILTVQYLLENKADPKLRLSAGHTAVHIACRSANVPTLHLLLSIKKEDGEDNEEEYKKREDKHLYDCLRIKDHASLTPVHWAATQESVSKRQKIFAYLDKRMPGVLDNRYNIHWFHSWAKTHPWVTEQKTIKNILSISPIQSASKLTNTDKIYRQYYEHGSSLPVTNLVSTDITSKTSLPDYERITKAAITNKYYEDIQDKINKKISPKIENSSPALSLPSTPITSCIVTSKHPFTYPEQPYMDKSAYIKNHLPTSAQKTPYSQRLPSNHSTYRAERVHVIPQSPPSHIPTKMSKGHDYEDIITPISSKRPSHNLLSNIVPSTTSSSEQSSRQSTKPFSSFGFDTSLNRSNHNDSIETSPQNYHDDQKLDYLCNSASTLDISSPGAYSYDI